MWSLINMMWHLHKYRYLKHVIDVPCYPLAMNTFFAHSKNNSIYKAPPLHCSHLFLLQFQTQNTFASTYRCCILGIRIFIFAVRVIGAPCACVMVIMFGWGWANGCGWCGDWSIFVANVGAAIRFIAIRAVCVNAHSSLWCGVHWIWRIPRNGLPQRSERVDTIN